MAYLIHTMDGQPFSQSRNCFPLQIGIASEALDDGYVKTEEIPDDWVMELKGQGQRACVGRETGYFYWTRAGWTANLDKIKEAWKRDLPNIPWSVAEQRAEEHFQSVHSACLKHEAELLKKLNQLRAAKARI